MRKLSIGALGAAVVLAAGVAMADQHMEAPKPGPETKKLEAFAGKWKGEANMNAGPWGPASKMTSESECSWFDGGFQLVCRETATGSMGKLKNNMVLGWSGEEKLYKYMGYDSMGMMGWATGTVAGNTWTWTGEDKMGGKLIKSRYTMVVTSPTSYTFKWETSEDGKSWTTAGEGKSTKR